MKIANDQILLMFVCFIFQQKKYQNKNLLYHGNLICFEKRKTQKEKNMTKQYCYLCFQKKNTNDRMLLLGVFLKKKNNRRTNSNIIVF